MYPLIRNLLFTLDAETAHHVTLSTLNGLHALRLQSLFIPRKYGRPKMLMGLSFPNRVGLAAGLDKNADYVDALGQLGFGFVEVGTVTPRPQAGNPKPRLFRLPDAQGIINRMGFNNKGVDYLVARLQKTRYQGIIGVNIGKNKDTPLESAHQDYLICLKKVYPFADYVTINISSPNTPGLRQLQHQNSLDHLLDFLFSARYALIQQTQRYVPLTVKLSPDLDASNLQTSIDILNSYPVDGVIASNTTLARPETIQTLANSQEQGGLSGAPLTQQASHTIQTLRQGLRANMPIIGVGGIMSVADAQDKIHAGADLVQIYSGLIYKGPKLVQKLLSTL